MFEIIQHWKHIAIKSKNSARVSGNFRRVKSLSKYPKSYPLERNPVHASILNHPRWHQELPESPGTEPLMVISCKINDSNKKSYHAPDRILENWTARRRTYQCHGGVNFPCHRKKWQLDQLQNINIEFQLWVLVITGVTEICRGLENKAWELCIT